MTERERANKLEREKRELEKELEVGVGGSYFSILHTICAPPHTHNTQHTQRKTAELERAQNDLRKMTTRANDAEKLYLNLKDAADKQIYNKPSPQKGRRYSDEPSKPTPKV